MWLDRSFCTLFSYWCKSEIMPSSLSSQTFSIPFTLGENSSANAQNPVLADIAFFFFFSSSRFSPFFSFLFVFTQKAKQIQTNSLLPGDTGEERWLWLHLQARASLEAQSERCRPAVHTCKVLCAQLGEVHMLMWVPPCGTVLAAEPRKEKPLVTLQ